MAETSGAFGVAPADATATFSLDVGRMVYKQVERELRRAAHGHLAIEVERHMGLLDGVLLVTVKGDSLKVTSFLNAIQKWTFPEAPR